MKNMITIALNTRCNQTCAYCPPVGESHSGVKGEICVNELTNTLTVMCDAGLDTFRFTGGEPFLHSKTNDILTLMKRLKSQGKTVFLNTNGVLVERFIDDISQSVDQVRISLDSLEIDKYKNITGTNKLEKVTTNIKRLRKAGVQVELIMVYMRYNKDELDNIIQFAAGTGCSLKVSDLEPHTFDHVGFFKDQYESTQSLMYALERQFNLTFQPTKSKGEPGLEMYVASINGVNVKIKSSLSKASYIEGCRSCSLFPCPEGVFSLILKPTNELNLCRREKLPSSFNSPSIENLLKFKDELSKSFRQDKGEMIPIQFISSDSNIEYSTIELANVASDWSYKGLHKDLPRD